MVSSTRQREWTESLRTGDSAAWRELFEFARAQVRRAGISARSLDHDELALEIVEDVFLALNRLRDAAKLVAFVAKICRDRVRRWRRELGELGVRLGKEPAATAVDSGRALDAIAEIGRLVGMLSAAEYALFRAWFLKGGPSRDVARELGISVASLHGRVSRLRKKLRARFRAEDGDGGSEPAAEAPADAC